MFQNKNPIIHGTNSNVLSGLELSEFHLMTPWNLFKEYGIVPNSGELDSLYSPTSHKYNNGVSFGKFTDNRFDWNHVLDNYAKHEDNFKENNGGAYGCSVNKQNLIKIRDIQNGISFNKEKSREHIQWMKGFYKGFSTLLMLNKFLFPNPDIKQFEGPPLPETPEEEEWKDQMAEIFKRSREPKRAETLDYALIDRYLLYDCELLDMVKRLEDKDPKYYYDIYHKYKDASELPEELKTELKNLFKLPKENEIVPPRESFFESDRLNPNERIRTKEDIEKYTRKSYYPRVCVSDDHELYPFIVRNNDLKVKYSEYEYHERPESWIGRMTMGGSESYNALLSYYFENRVNIMFKNKFHDVLIKYLDGYWEGIEMLQKIIDGTIPIKPYFFDSDNFPIVFIIDQHGEDILDISGNLSKKFPGKKDKIKLGVDITCWATDTVANKQILDEYSKKHGLNMRSLLFKDIQSYLYSLK